MSVRQQALATAQVYIRRFYSKVAIRRTNPYLVLVTALYLACKMEECPQHIRVVVSEARQLWPGSSFLKTWHSQWLNYLPSRLHHLRCFKIGRIRIFLDFRDEFTAHSAPPLSYST